ncbi:I-set domain containing protein, partial [Asbolus verrucosus]
MWLEFAVVAQFYDIDVNKEYAIRGNAAILKCQIPSFVADFVSVVSWHTDQNENFYPGAPDVVQQFYQTEVNNEYVIRGNAAVLKCSIPSFVADFVNVVSWHDTEGHNYAMEQSNYVVNQYYEAEVVSEYVIRGNTAVLKCNIPSFVADFVRVEAWVGSDGNEYNHSSNYVVNQFYKAEILTEYVIRGNTAVLKCSIPSFVADFVFVESWIDDAGNVMKASNDYVVAQYYVTEAENEYVIRGNSAVMKCKIPSFVADFVLIDAWIADDGQVHKYNDNSSYVVAQSYEVEADNEYVIRGNSAVMKCEVPSFVSDFVVVENWQDSKGNSYLPGDDYVVKQFYQSRVIDEFVLKGNTGILKCLVPSFVTDFVQVEAWVADDGVLYEYDPNLSKMQENCSHLSFLSIVPVVNQYYEAQVYDVFVIKGNTAVFKCQIPSFVSDHVDIISWQDTANNKYLPPVDDYVVSQSYNANVMDESVLKGNTAIFKCHIPSFVSDYVFVISWLQDDNNEIVTKDDQYGAFNEVSMTANIWFYHLESCTSEMSDLKTDTNLTNAVRNTDLLVKQDLAPQRVDWSSRNLSVSNLQLFLMMLQAYPTLVLLIKVLGFCVKLKHILFQVSEPTNNVPPKKDFQRFEGHQVVNVPNLGTAWLTCQVTGYPVPRYMWYKFVEGTTRKQAVTLNDRVKQVAGTLIIREARVEDSGKYLCVVNNSVGGESVETVLTVTAPLKAKIEPQVQTIDFGRPAVFTCNFEGNPIKTINWLKDGHPIDHTDAVLRIESVRKEDKGMYQCFIRNDQESAEAIAELKLGGRFEPPQIRHAFNEETVQPGNSVFMKCIASGNPTPEITWELYGRRLSNSERYQIGQYVTVNGDVVSHLNITAIHTNDGGLYRCVASSKVGSADHSARINVYGLPFVRSMEKQAIVAGGTLIVHCPFAGHPVETVVWERGWLVFFLVYSLVHRTVPDGRLLPINRKQKVFPNGTLIIENVERASDQATYDCVAKNSQGYSARGSLEVQVMVSPQIFPFTFGDAPINSGETVSIQCTILKGDSPLNLTWSLNSVPVGQNDGITVMKMKRFSSLNIDSVQAVHTGKYTCTATNFAGSSSYSAYLSVNVPPQIVPFDFGETTTNSGDMATVNCAVTKGDFPMNISWSLNGKPISEVSGVTVGQINKRISTLSVDSVEAQHAGEYVCTAQNKAGTITHSAALYVNGIYFNFT